MLSTAALARKAAETGDPLPMPWHVLRDAGLELHRGQLSLITSAPSVGKSTFAHLYAVRAQLRTLYFCPDTPATDMQLRTHQMLRNTTRDQVDGAVAAHAPDLWWSFSSNLTVRLMVAEVMAYAEIMGDTPQLVVVDSLRNVQGPTGDEQIRLFERIMLDLQKLAREAHTHVMVCHHVTGQYNDGNRVIPLSGVEDQISKQPDCVLTLCREYDKMTVAIVKNRAGRGDPTGKYNVTLWADMSRMQIDDHRQYEVSYG